MLSIESPRKAITSTTRSGGTPGVVTSAREIAALSVATVPPDAAGAPIQVLDHHARGVAEGGVTEHVLAPDVQDAAAIEISRNIGQAAAGTESVARSIAGTATATENTASDVRSFGPKPILVRIQGHVGTAVHLGDLEPRDLVEPAAARHHLLPLPERAAHGPGRPAADALARSDHGCGRASADRQPLHQGF